MVTETEEKATDPALKRSVIDRPTATPSVVPPASISDLLWVVAEAADEFQPWGARMKTRDSQLRDWWPTESYFASALAGVVGRNTAFSWELEGPASTVKRVQDVLTNANDGQGWHDLVSKLSIDLYTQDHGAFMEVVRGGDSEAAPVIALNHLDSFRCYHTGDPKAPVLYQDRQSKLHLLKWYQVETYADMPAPIEGLYGLQYCALTRMLRAAQLIRNVMIYQVEKTGGRFNRALHIVQGISTQQVEDALKQQTAGMDARGLLRYLQPLIVGTLSPEANIDVKTLELASLPEGWDQEVMFKWYVTILAMAFMGDYQDFAPLPSGNLGSGQQSSILHLKSQQKGAALFQKLLTHSLNFRVLPKAVEFGFTEQDVQEEETRAAIAKTRAETREIQVRTGELTPEAARQLAYDYGDISEELFNALGGVDVTPNVTQEDEDQPERPAPPAPAQLPVAPEEIDEEVKAARAGPFRGGAAESGAALRIRLREGAWEDVPRRKAAAGRRPRGRR